MTVNSYDFGPSSFMRVLQLISSGGFYGAEAMLLNLATALHGTCVDVLIGAIRNSSNPHTEVADRAKGAGVPAVTIRCDGRFDVGCIARIVSLIRKSGIDIVHTHGYKADVYGYLAAKLCRTPVTATCHNWTNDSAALGIYAHLDRLVLRHFPIITAVSGNVACHLSCSGVRDSSLRIIGNGINFVAFAAAEPLELYPDATRPFIIGMVGRLVRDKAFDHVLRAGAHLAAQYPHLRFVIVGDGPEREALTRLCIELGLHERVLFTGQRSDMPAVYKSFNVFVLPSLNEGMPMTVLEAMASGRAVIATEVGALPDIVHHGRTGFLFQAGDVSTLESILQQLIRDQEFGRSVGQAASAFVDQHYSQTSMARAYQEVYGELLGLPPGRGAGTSSRCMKEQSC